VYFPYTAHTSSTALRRALDMISAGAGLDGGGRAAIV
jgi:hypothetical protein